MRPFLMSRRMTSTTTLRRGKESAAIDVPPALLIKIASRCPNARPGPLPGAYRFIRTTQERARYRPGLVDRHVHKVGEPVDEGGHPAGEAVDDGARRPCQR